MRSAGRDELDGRRGVVVARVWPSVARGTTPVKRALGDVLEYVELDPTRMPGQAFALRRAGRRGHGFEYVL